jgi:hypothetical protein
MRRRPRRNVLPERLVGRTVKTAVRIAHGKAPPRNVLSRRVRWLVNDALKSLAHPGGMSLWTRCWQGLASFGKWLCRRRTAGPGPSATPGRR